MELIGIKVTENEIAITISNSNTIFNIPYVNIIHFKDCSFTRIDGDHGAGLIMAITDYHGLTLSPILIENCRFTNINSSVIIRTYVQKAVPCRCYIANDYPQHIIFNT